MIELQLKSYSLVSFTGKVVLKSEIVLKSGLFIYGYFVGLSKDGIPIFSKDADRSRHWYEQEGYQKAIEIYNEIQKINLDCETFEMIGNRQENEDVAIAAKVAFIWV